MRVTWCLAFHWLGCRTEETPPAKTEPTTSSPIPTTTTTPTDTITIDLCPGEPPRALSIDVTGRATLVNTLDVAVTLDSEAAAAVVCARGDDPTEELLYTSPAATEHLIPMRGLAADTTYACRFVATCPASAAPVVFEVTTDPLPEVIPSVAVSAPTGLDSTAPPFVLLGHDRHCPGDSARLLMYDVRGEIRWYYEQVPDIDIAYESQYLGDGELTWGGGFYDTAPPELFDVDHNTLYVTSSEITATHVFHHDGRLLPNGQMMAMMIEPNTADGFAWDGFSIGLVDPATGVDTFFYSSQEAVDDGDLQPGWGDPWHANWADYQEDPVNGDRLYVSLCSLGDIIAIDAATKDVLWTFGDTGDFQLVNTAGEPVPQAFAWPQCQHGLEFVPFAGGGGGNLLVYDNGAHGRGFSRLAEYELDETTMVATLLWSWSEPVWMEPSWGDVDYLDNGNVLGTMGHACWSPNIEDVSSVVELDPVAEQVVWRMDFLSPGDAIYRSERVDACDVLPISGLCPAVDAALPDLRPLLDPCSPGGTDVDQDGDGAMLCADADCDDLNADVYPGNPEICDGFDNDCNGLADESEGCWDCAATGDYLVCSAAVPWAYARDACLGLGYDLATVDDGAENEVIGDLAGAASWIGLNDIAAEGTFEWADGTPLGYTSWWVDEPSNSYDEDCAGINFGDIGGWNDYPCGELLPFVCER